MPGTAFHLSNDQRSASCADAPDVSRTEFDASYLSLDPSRTSFRNSNEFRAPHSPTVLGPRVCDSLHTCGGTSGSGLSLPVHRDLSVSCSTNSDVGFDTTGLAQRFQ